MNSIVTCRKKHYLFLPETCTVEPRNSILQNSAKPRISAHFSNDNFLTNSSIKIKEAARSWYLQFTSEFMS